MSDTPNTSFPWAVHSNQRFVIARFATEHQAKVYARWRNDECQRRVWKVSEYDSLT